MIFLRHGAYDEGEDVLNERGLIQTTQAIAALKNLVNRPTIISSQGPRAKQTAEMVAKSFDTPFSVVNWLNRPSNIRPFDLHSIMKEIKQLSTGDPLVLVTNGEFIHEFVDEFVRDRQMANPLKPLVKGEVMLCRVSDKNIEVDYF